MNFKQTLSVARNILQRGFNIANDLQMICTFTDYIEHIDFSRFNT